MVSERLPPWAAYRAMMYCRLIVLKKCLGVRQIRIGDIFRRLVCKKFLSITGNKATRACGTDQLSCGLEAGIEGSIRHVRSLWEENLDSEDPWGVLLIDIRNALNEENRKLMVWMARHE